MSVNVNLIGLKCVLFLFFGAISSLYPFLAVHMNDIGLSKDESILVSIIAPLIAAIGPLIAAPLADRLAGGFGGAQRSKTGRYLRVMIATCMILAVIFYWFLYLIPPIVRSPPNVSFICDENGGFILQERCGTDKTCYKWGSKKGSVLVKNCIFSCNVSASYTGEITTIYPEEEINDFNGESDYYDGSDAIILDGQGQQPFYANDTAQFEPHPHMCYRNASGGVICEVYTEYSKLIDFRIGLHPTLNDNDTEEICKYPFDDEFHCRINPNVIKNLTSDRDEDCHPMVLCEIYNPYNNKNSLLKTSQCGYNNISFWLYLFIRSIADIFPAAAVTLLATAAVIATRETSTGRGDIGKQYAAGALGFAIFAPIIGGSANGGYLEAVLCFSVLSVIAILVLLLDKKMPLSPPEWWWHTRCGLLALPMSSVRSYGFETAALGGVLFLLGLFWNAIDTFLPWHIVKIPYGDHFITGFSITMGALPAVVFLIYAERFVDYCGHSNILIFCFINYICHHLTLLCVDNANYLLLAEWMEVFTLHVMYITAVLYLRHLVPRKFTACAQALPIIAHFCLGRCFGALLGGMAYSEYPDNFKDVHEGFTIAAAVVAIMYFIAYHFYLKQKCAAPLHLPPDPAPAVIQSMNGNGSYTPLRVYHNSKSKKGHFRY